LKLSSIRESARGSLWFLPSLCVGSVVVLSEVLLRVDESAVETDFAFGGGAESARGFLQAIAASMIGLTGIVFTITIVVLQLASQQFSPRVLRTFLRDRHSQLALGVFIATFTYALLVLREVRTEETSNGEFIPGISISIGFLLVMVSVGFFVHYINHIAQSIRVATITRSIGSETRATIAGLFENAPTGDPRPLPAGRSSVTLTSPEQGVLQSIDTHRMIELGRKRGAVITVIPAVGDYVPRGSKVLEVSGGDAGDAEDYLGALSLGAERTMQQEPAFGLRQLVDIAERALSPSFNDPTTAVQCLDQIHDLLRDLAARPFPSGQWLDDDDAVRVVVPVVSWADYVSLAFDEIRHYGEDAIQVHRRMRAALEDLLTVAPPERAEPLRAQLRLLGRAAERGFPDPSDRVTAGHSDEQGLGAG
jgi:uncharacterized membrane protein